MLEIHDVRLALDARAALAECPLWSVREQKLFWVDISGRTINRFDPSTGEDVRWPMPCEPGCIALAASGGLVAALRAGLYRFFPADERLQTLADAPYDAMP
ncbi:MAG: SMP-30/gluconolactonase/LRE family protein, partial [Usitatibacteraceae bacterium]